MMRTVKPDKHMQMPRLLEILVLLGVPQILGFSVKDKIRAGKLCVALLSLQDHAFK